MCTARRSLYAHWRTGRRIVNPAPTHRSSHDCKLVRFALLRKQHRGFKQSALVVRTRLWKRFTAANQNRAGIMRVATVFLLALLASGVQLSVQSRRRRHNHHEDSNLPFEPVANKTEASGQLQKMLQTSPKDALIVTKRRYLRKDWCKSQPLIQRIGQDHCLSTTVLNRFCYGQCNSFYIPKNQLKADGQHAAADGPVASGRAFKSCAVCQPKKTSWVTVTLKCPSLVPNIRRRRVQIINQCRCMQESPS